MSYQSVEAERNLGRIAAANIDANSRENIANIQAGTAMSNASTQADTSRYGIDQGLYGQMYGADSRLKEAQTPRQYTSIQRNEGTFIPDEPSPWLPPLNDDLTRAGGGPVRRNAPYWVGERGPELMVPDQNGTIIPNHAFRGVAAVPRAEGGRVQAGGAPYTEGYDSRGNKGRWYSPEGFKGLQQQQQMEQRLRAEKELNADKVWHERSAKAYDLQEMDRRGWIPSGVQRDATKNPEQVAHDTALKSMQTRWKTETIPQLANTFSQRNGRSMTDGEMAVLQSYGPQQIFEANRHLKTPDYAVIEKLGPSKSGWEGQKYLAESYAKDPKWNYSNGEWKQLGGNPNASPVEKITQGSPSAAQLPGPTPWYQFAKPLGEEPPAGYQTIKNKIINPIRAWSASNAPAPGDTIPTGFGAIGNAVKNSGLWPTPNPNEEPPKW
ncbi:MAG: hypothetical protein WC356_02255 [Candidatus Micrarchaeia archaeon]|jgi:hypothetical protein